MNLLLRFLAGFVKLINLIVGPIIALRARGKKRAVPPIKSALLTISATDLAEKIRNREVTSEQVCRAYIERIKEVNPMINAVVEERFENALEDAREVDKYLQTTQINCDELKQFKPLLGVPLTVKESCSVAGLSLTGGTLSRKGIKAHTDSEVVCKLRATGAIPLLVSNTPEICLSWESRNFITGTTNNPYDTTRTSSGSSGGEGALLGAGASLIGIGSDIAGSIRLPAMFNGVFGHKPTPRVIPIKNHYPYCMDPKYPDYLVIGPMTRYAKDLKLMTEVMCDTPEILELDQQVNLSELRIYFMEEFGKSLVFPSVQNEIKIKIRQSVNYLKDTFKCTVMDHKFTKLENSCEIFGSTLFTIKDIPYLLKGGNENIAVELLKSLCGASKYTFNLLLFYCMQLLYKNCIINEEYIRQNGEMRQEFIEKLGTNGVFLYPTFATSAFRHNTSFFWAYSISYLKIANTLGLPATHVPCGLDKNGLPIGFQVIAAPNQDRLCFAVAEQLEKYFGGWTPPSN